MALSPGELLQTGGVFVAAGALFLNWWQLRKNTLQRRSEHITGLFAKYHEDPDTVEMFRRVDHGEEIFNNNFHGSPDETKLDKLLFIFERIATLYEMGVIVPADLMFLTYEFIRISDNQSIRDYFAWLDDWYKDRGIPGENFGALRRVAERMRQDIKSKRMPKTHTDTPPITPKKENGSDRAGD